ncbi:MAG: T9SS type A sorting domain-containing protein, partial [Bacteroidota bacterium]
QIQLFAWEEDRVQITYGTMGLNPDITSNLSVGMKGADMNDFALRTTDATHPWDNTLTATTISNTCELSVTSNPMNAAHNFMSWLNKGTTGLKEHAAGIAFSLYPLPANDVLFVKEADKYEVEKYEIYDVSGRLLVQDAYSGGGIPVSAMLPGLYLIRLSASSGTSTLKFIKG